jgi:ankyrin repeat protein
LRENGRLDIVESFVKYGADVNAKNVQGKTALMNASRQGNLEIVKYLVENGAEIDANDNEKNKALLLV